MVFAPIKKGLGAILIFHVLHKDIFDLFIKGVLKLVEIQGDLH
jgi:hypothetical protein